MRLGMQLWLAMLLLVVLVLGGCEAGGVEPLPLTPAAEPDTAEQATAPAEEPASTEAAPAAAATVPVAEGVYTPVPADVCETLKTDAETALKVTFAMSEAPFLNYVTQEAGTGCRLTAEGTGATFTGPGDVVNALRTVFVGWTEDMSYAADGPTGSSIGMTRDAGLLLISANWTPAPDANCPQDQPISACELTPEQKLYVVTVDAAMK